MPRTAARVTQADIARALRAAQQVGTPDDNVIMIGKCYYCQRELKSSKDKSNLALTRDHIHPKSRGGRKTVIACRACNHIKGDMLFSQWVAFMNENPEWWKSYNKNKHRNLSRSSYRMPAENNDTNHFRKQRKSRSLEEYLKISQYIKLRRRRGK